MLAEIKPSFQRQETAKSPDFLHLPGTGYDVRSDVGRFTQDVKRLQDEGKSFQESTKIASFAIAENMRGYRREYVMRFCAFPNPVEFENTTEGRIIVAPKYANARLEDTVMYRERNGAVYDATKETVKILKTAPNGSLVVWTSPPGDAGWNTRSGEPVVYPDSLTFAYRVNLFGELEAMSFVTDMTTSQNEKLIQILAEKGVSFESEEDVVRTVVYKKASENQRYTLEHVVDAMELAKNSKFARENVTFDEMRYLVRNKDEVVWEDEKAEMIMQDFLGWVETNVLDMDQETMLLLQQKIAKTVMDLVAHSSNYNSEISKDGFVDYQKILEIMRLLGGCAGGGMAGGRRTVEAKFVKNCGKCGATINSHIAAGYVCPKCEGVYLGC